QADLLRQYAPEVCHFLPMTLLQNLLSRKRCRRQVGGHGVLHLTRHAFGLVREKRRALLRTFFVRPLCEDANLCEGRTRKRELLDVRRRIVRDVGRVGLHPAGDRLRQKRASNERPGDQDERRDEQRGERPLRRISGHGRASPPGSTNFTTLARAPAGASPEGIAPSDRRGAPASSVLSRQRARLSVPGLQRRLSRLICARNGTSPSTKSFCGLAELGSLWAYVSWRSMSVRFCSGMFDWLARSAAASRTLCPPSAAPKA